MNYLENYYNAYDEEGRLLSRHGQVEYLTTMKSSGSVSQMCPNLQSWRWVRGPDGTA